MFILTMFFIGIAIRIAIIIDTGGCVIYHPRFEF